MVPQGLHLGPPFSAPVTPGLHGHGQVVGPSEGGHKEGHQDRDHALGPLDDVPALQICPPGDLGLHDLIRLFQKDGDEPQGDGHHHGHLMDRHMDLLQRIQKFLNAVGQRVWRGGEGHKGRPDDQVDQPDPHVHRRVQPTCRDGEDPPLPEHLPASGEKQIEKDGDQKQQHNGLQSLHNIGERHFGHTDDPHQEDGGHQIPCKIPEQKQGDQVQKGADDLHPRVQPVEDTFCRIILSDGNISNHASFSIAFMIS